MGIKPQEDLYDKNNLVTVRFIVQVVPNVPFKILIRNFGKKVYFLSKIQSVAHLVPQNTG